MASDIVYVNGEKLVQITDSMLQKSNDIKDVFNGECVTAIRASDSALKLSGYSSEKMITLLTKIFENLNIRIDSFAKFVSKNVSDEYYYTSRFIEQSFNREMGAKLAKLLGITQTPLVVATTAAAGGITTAGGVSSSGGGSSKKKEEETTEQANNNIDSSKVATGNVTSTTLENEQKKLLTMQDQLDAKNAEMADKKLILQACYDNGKFSKDLPIVEDLKRIFGGEAVNKVIANPTASNGSVGQVALQLLAGGDPYDTVNLGPEYNAYSGLNYETKVIQPLQNEITNLQCDIDAQREVVQKSVEANVAAYNAAVAGDTSNNGVASITNTTTGNTTRYATIPGNTTTTTIANNVSNGTSPSPKVSITQDKVITANGQTTNLYTVTNSKGTTVQSTGGNQRFDASRPMTGATSQQYVAAAKANGVTPNQSRSTTLPTTPKTSVTSSSSSGRAFDASRPMIGATPSQYSAAVRTSTTPRSFRGR